MKGKDRFYFLLGLAMFLAIFWALFGGSAQADDTVTMECDPPTHRVANNDCDQQGTPLTAAEIETLTYTFSYRPKGVGAPWVNKEVPNPTAEITLTGYGVTYEVVVGARFPGGPILCATEPPVEYKTGPDTSPAGPCSALLVTKKPQS